jgi:hypothetical protein
MAELATGRATGDAQKQRPEQKMSPALAQLVRSLVYQSCLLPLPCYME